MALYGIANTQLSDTFNTWRVASNSIKTQAASATGNNQFTGSTNQFDSAATFTAPTIFTGNTTFTGNPVTFNANTVVVNNNLNVDSGTLFINTTSNRVGVNKTNPATALDVNGTVTATAVSTGAVTGTTASFSGAVTLGDANTDPTTIRGSTSIGTNLTVIANTSVDRLFAGHKAQHWDAQTGTEADHHAFISANTDIYGGLGIRNVRNGSSSSSDLMVYAANGTDTAGYIEMGVNSSTYNDPAWAVSGADDGYIFYDAVTGATGRGDLILATGTNGTNNRIILAAGGFGANVTPIIIDPTTGMKIEYATTSTTPSTGALTVVGGAGIQGNLNVQGNFNLVGSISIGGSGSVTTTTTLSVANSIIRLAANNASDVVDVGEVASYTNAGTKYTGLVRDATDKVWKFFSGISSNPTTTVDFTGATYDAVRLGALTATDITASGTVLLNGPVTLGDTTSDLTTVSGRMTVGTNLAVTGNTALNGNLVIGDGAADTVTFNANTVTLGSNLNIDSATMFINGTNNRVGFGTTTPNAPVQVAGTFSMQQVLEKVTVSATAAGSTVNFDALTQGVMYYTSNSTGNWTLNVRGDGSTTLDSMMAVGQALTITFMATNTTAYYQTGFTIDGTSKTIKWADGSAPSSGNANATDLYTFTIIKTGSATYTVLGQQAKFA